MGARTSGRLSGLQMLFSVEVSGNDAESTIRNYWREFDGDPEGRFYADEILRGVTSSLAEVDETIRRASTNWRLERMTRVDRNLLRLATWELLFCKELPRAVILDEAVELAKRFGTEESSSFVNGVLDRVAENCGRVDADRSGSQS